MEDDWHFPDGRTFADIVGPSNSVDTDHLDDAASALGPGSRLKVAKTRPKKHLCVIQN